MSRGLGDVYKRQPLSEYCVNEADYPPTVILGYATLSEEEIRDYIAGGEPMDKAGAYAIQGIGAKFIQKIEGDYNNVVGLPIGRIYQEIKRKSIEIPTRF